PVVFSWSAPEPVAVFSKPVVLVTSAKAPVAVLVLPVVLLMSALSPRKVLPLVRSQPCWQTARACGASASHPRASANSANAGEVKLVIVFMVYFLSSFFSRISGRKFLKIFPEQEFLGPLRLIVWLCERAFRSRFTQREEGQVELFGETPNELSAGTILPTAGRQCQSDFCESPIPIPETQLAFHPPAQRNGCAASTCRLDWRLTPATFAASTHSSSAGASVLTV